MASLDINLTGWLYRTVLCSFPSIGVGMICALGGAHSISCAIHVQYNNLINMIGQTLTRINNIGEGYSPYSPHGSYTYA